MSSHFGRIDEISVIRCFLWVFL
uniref:Uncharacterized protein n=1 Tax=Romanomermis culicivorax TaxID=13658 RepID=A0A915HTH8_ROMCU